MKQVFFTIDSAGDLPEGFGEQYHNIETIPLYINLGDESFTDGVDINADDVIDYVNRTGNLPKTSAVAVGDYSEVFKRLTDAGFSVVHIGLSSGISSSYQNAVMAAEGFEDVYVIDSGLLSSSMALLLMKGCGLRQKGSSAAEIADTLERLKEKVVTSFVINRLDYLHKGGRCSMLAAFGANALGLKPCIEMKNGTLDIKKKYRGKLLNCQLDYINDMLDEYSGQVDKSAVSITFTSGLSSDDIEALKEQIKKNLDFDKIYIGHAGCTVTSHCGAKTMGILFMIK